MKFPRKAKIFYGGRLDFAPFASVFFLLVVFLMFNPLLIPFPGVKMRQPQSVRPNLPQLEAAIADGGQIHFKSQFVSPEEFREKLARAVAQSERPPSLIVLMGKKAGYETFSQVYQIAQEEGVGQVFQVGLGEAFGPDDSALFQQNQ